MNLNLMPSRGNHGMGAHPSHEFRMLDMLNTSFSTTWQSQDQLGHGAPRFGDSLLHWRPRGTKTEANSKSCEQR